MIQARAARWLGPFTKTAGQGAAVSCCRHVEVPIPASSWIFFTPKLHHHGFFPFQRPEAGRLPLQGCIIAKFFRLAGLLLSEERASGRMSCASSAAPLWVDEANQKVSFWNLVASRAPAGRAPLRTLVPCARRSNTAAGAHPVRLPSEHRCWRSSHAPAGRTQRQPENSRAKPAPIEDLWRFRKAPCRWAKNRRKVDGHTCPSTLIAALSLGHDVVLEPAAKPSKRSHRVCGEAAEGALVCFGSPVRGRAPKANSPCAHMPPLPDRPQAISSFTEGLLFSLALIGC